MESKINFVDTLKRFGIGQRNLDDKLFKRDKSPPKISVYDEDEENLCHEIIQCACPVPNCQFTSESLLEFENHYNVSHRYSCGECKKTLPSPHLLDIHIQEKHDSFFAVLSLKKPSYCCYIEDCKEKFLTASDRHNHCVEIHKLPKNFRFEPSILKAVTKKSSKKKKHHNNHSMEVDNNLLATNKANSLEDSNKHKNFSFSNSRQKAFIHYLGKPSAANKGVKEDRTVNIDEIMADIKESLPSLK